MRRWRSAVGAASADTRPWPSTSSDEIDAHEGARAAAEPVYRQALALADELGMRPLADRCRAALNPPGA